MARDSIQLNFIYVESITILVKILTPKQAKIMDKLHLAELWC